MVGTRLHPPQTEKIICFELFRERDDSHGDRTVVLISYGTMYGSDIALGLN